MNNLSFPKSFTEEKDSGERTVYWVRVKDRLPSSDIKCLVQLDFDSFLKVEDYITVGCYFKDGKFFNINGETLMGNVVAWMKLPEKLKV